MFLFFRLFFVHIKTSGKTSFFWVFEKSLFFKTNGKQSFPGLLKFSKILETSGKCSIFLGIWKPKVSKTFINN